MTEVKVGQIWQDNDTRVAVRDFEVLEVKDGKARCQRGSRKVWISLKRMRDTLGSRSYKLIKP